MLAQRITVWYNLEVTQIFSDLIVVTWDSEYFSEKNASIYIMADYVNSTGGPIAFQSSIESASTGFLAWTVQKEWLQDQSSNNITLFINPIHPNGEAIRLPGKNIS